MRKIIFILAVIYNTCAMSQVSIPQAAAIAGFNSLVYQDKFHPLDWATQFPWGPAYASTGIFTASPGMLTITGAAGSQPAYSMIADHPLNTLPATGYQFGYFEARLRFQKPIWRCKE